ncbi:MAG: aldehyde dehydrogenase (NADP(+)) [Verrucomicrobiales bacterium]|nr:aldehyde dehydrogenase (NADP(+)) [Verrucomicrobiales bacterium]
MSVMTGKQLIGFGESGEGEESIRAVNPATGEVLEPGFCEAVEGEIDRAMGLAAEAAVEMRRFSGEKLAGLCEAIAEELEAAKGQLLERCGVETGYPEARLNGEFGRTVGQMRQFAAVAREGRWLHAVIDHGDPSRQPLPKPDVRRMMVALGPVVVFGASNFPLALSAAGGDTASALAAGCPVVVKGHPSHPGTCEIAARAIVAAVKRCGFPEGTFSMVQGASNRVGGLLVKHEETAAVGFTGSLKGGRALFDLAADRPVPIPVYAEMGSINPQFVMPGVLDSDPEGFAEALFGSVTLGNGQFCTNPGIVFVVKGAEGTDTFLRKYKELVAESEAAAVLNQGIADGYENGVVALESIEGIEVSRGRGGDRGIRVGAVVAVSDLSVFVENRDRLEEEVFGPSTVIVQCRGLSDFGSVAESFPGQLASSVHGTESDLSGCGVLIEDLSRSAGRIIVNGFPTGIEICEGMHHGGRYPAATDSHFTSIGFGAIARWGRPVAFQGMPQSLLPPALRDDNPLRISRVVDGSPQG